MHSSAGSFILRDCAGVTEPYRDATTVGQFGGKERLSQEYSQRRELLDLMRYGWIFRLSRTAERMNPPRLQQSRVLQCWRTPSTEFGSSISGLTGLRNA